VTGDMAREADRYVRPSAFEIAVCWMHGVDPPTAVPPTSKSPRDALDDAIRPALVGGPCFVTFSGGRDSSAVLAAATELARRDGLPDPIPVTRTYPGIPESDESEWQRLVIDHLGLREWVRLEFRHGETDLLGDAAREGLLGRGVVWPPALQVQSTVYRHLDAGSMLTGEGGDETLGARRVTPLTLLQKRLRTRQRPTRTLLAWAARSVQPGPLRRALGRAELGGSAVQSWLQPEVLRHHHALVAHDDATEPLAYDNAVWWVTRKRNWATLDHNQAVAAAEYGVRAINPLLDHGFLAALAHFGGRWGFAGRTATMKALFSDVLPVDVLSRSTKARFNGAYSGEATREFAASWDGSGVDPELVDVDRLRQMWLSDSPTASTALLLHSAWLAAQPTPQRAAS